MNEKQGKQKNEKKREDGEMKTLEVRHVLSHDISHEKEVLRWDSGEFGEGKEKGTDWVKGGEGTHLWATEKKYGSDGRMAVTKDNGPSGRRGRKRRDRRDETKEI